MKNRSKNFDSYRFCVQNAFFFRLICAKANMGSFDHKPYLNTLSKTLCHRLNNALWHVTVTINTHTEWERDTTKKRDILVPNLHVYDVQSWHCKLFVFSIFPVSSSKMAQTRYLPTKLRWIESLPKENHILFFPIFKLVGGDRIEFTKPTSSNKVQFYFCFFQFNFVCAYCDSFAYEDATGSENIRSF